MIIAMIRLQMIFDFLNSKRVSMLEYRANKITLGEHSCKFMNFDHPNTFTNIIYVIGVKTKLSSRKKPLFDRVFITSTTSRPSFFNFF